jgi:CRP/FNR family cyclic AMP-dependent transcriptional regulator
LNTPSRTVAEALKFLGGIPLFSNLDEKALNLLAHSPKFQHMEKGTILFFQSDPSEFAYIVRNGNIFIVLRSPDSRDMIINEMRPGDFFGEVTALTGMQRTANVITEEDIEFLSIPSKVLKRLARNYPALNVMLHTTIGERLSITERPHGTGYDQQMLRKLRTNQPDIEKELAAT